MKKMEIEKCFKEFLNSRKPDERDASFDYCYNYFYSFYEQKKLNELADKNNIQISCLHLGFFLASWGMFRASSSLLQKSLGYYRNVIVAISGMDEKFWKIDVNNYEENIDLLLNCKKQINEALGEGKHSDTRLTKIMLGVFANVPAFDQNFRRSMGVHSFNKKSLEKIEEFYDDHKIEFEELELKYAEYLWTLDFSTGQNTNIRYTKAKIIDMCCFIHGRQLSKEKENGTS